jgi:nucleotide-binding universal stress UspA family protein
MFQKILVPIDGSKPAHNALVNALQMAKIHGSEVEILHVMTFTEDLPPEPKKSEKNDSPGWWIEDYVTRVRKKDEKMLNDAIEEAKTVDLSDKVASKLLIGKPGDVIITEASQGGFDLIVIGNRGLGGFKELVLGSVSHQVVNESKIPVLVVK